MTFFFLPSLSCWRELQQSSPSHFDLCNTHQLCAGNAVFVCVNGKCMASCACEGQQSQVLLSIRAPCTA